MRISSIRAQRQLPGFLLAVALLAVVSQTSGAERLQFPAIAEPPSAEHHVGKVIWADLVTPDLAGAKRFYAGLFGWTFRDVAGGEATYSVALLDGRPVGGVFQRALAAGEKRQPAWLTFIAVSNVDATRATAQAHGAKVLFEPKSFAARGRQAVLADPDGAVFAILASSSGDPADYLALPGEWIWSSLLTRDPSAAATFYQALLGYDVFDLESEDGSDHLILSSDDYARASVKALPAAATHGHPHWLNFVRVVDTADTAAKVVVLGGRVLVEPHSDRHGGRVAVVADPSGAPFGLMEWTDSDSKVEPK